ncbi:MAG: multidrug resistance transporter, superfamily protein [Solirubrobacterales bacterium]|nr:multidrug resistance transporter, superfamily protein [Solirubrobacterales bacterium]
MTTDTAGPLSLETRRGKLILALLCSVAFLDFVDASIVNVALPSIRQALHFSVQGLQWVPSAYLLTYGGFMLLGGRAADLLGRRNVLVAGTALLGLSSLIGGLAGSSGVLIGARLAQGIGAAMMLPAALSILTTTFKEGKDRHTALGVWGGVGGLASAIGVLAGGLLTEGPGWRWVMFVNPIASVLVLGGIYALVSGERRRAQLANFDILGALLATGGMLLLVYTLVEAPTVGWSAAGTIAGLAGALAILAGFIANERRHRNPLAPLSIFRINGLGFSDVTQLIAFAGFLAMFFFLTLYMQNVLHYSAIEAGAAYVPLAFTVGISAGISSQLLSRVGTRPVIVAGALIASGGMYWLSRIPVHGTYLANLLPAMLVLSVGFGPVFVGVTTAANAGVPADKAGLAASLLNASQQLGGALGLAIFSAVATSRTSHLIAAHTAVPQALTSGFQRALTVGSVFLLASAVIALKATNTRGETAEGDGQSSSAAATSAEPALKAA